MKQQGGYIALSSHGRKRNRLAGYDYSYDGEYFVTICIKNRREIFGWVKNEEMVLNEYGEIVSACWYDLPNHYGNCELDEFIVMPNHVHGIVIINNEKINNPVGTGFKPENSKNITVGTGFKPNNVNNIDPVGADLKPENIKNITVGTGFKPVPTGKRKPYSLSEIVRGFKTFSSRKINLFNPLIEFRWQRSFYDHIILSERSLYEIRDYIYYNPAKWEDDRNNLKNLYM